MTSHSELRIREMLNKLREKSFRVTPQRYAVVRVLSESKNHPSVERIYEEVKADFPTTSLATIYKTINLLKDVGEVTELEFSHGSSRNPHPHPHLICLQCNDIVDPDVDTLHDLPKDLAKKTGFKILYQRMDFFGICPICQKKSH